MARFLIIGGVLALMFWVVSIVDCAVQPPIRHRGVRKGIWVLIVVVLPVIGGILWFTIGRTSKNSPAIAAPDDDPTFLSSLSGGPAGPIGHDRISASEQDERIRRLEEELAKLDAEEQQAGDQAPHHDDDDLRGRHGSPN